MKEKAIKKINSIGNVCHIFAIITKVLLIISFVALIGTSFVIAILPNDLVTATMSGKTSINVNLEDFDVKFSDEDRTKITEALTGDDNANIKVNNSDYGIIETEVGESYIDMKAETPEVIFFFKDLLVILFAAMLTTAMSFVTVIFVDRLFVALKNCSSPFDENVIKKMQQFAYSLIPWSIISSMSDSVITSFFAAKVNVTLKIDFRMLFMVLIILAIAYIFKYGAILQQESDETL